MQDFVSYLFVVEDLGVTSERLVFIQIPLGTSFPQFCVFGLYWRILIRRRQDQNVLELRNSHLLGFDRLDIVFLFQLFDLLVIFGLQDGFPELIVLKYAGP